MANTTSDRRVPPGGGIVIGLVLGIMLWFALIGIATAQEKAPQQPQQFFVFVDTLGISAVEGMPGIYMTWVFAKATPRAYPSSGILVAWDCLRSPRMVKRLAQVVYRMNADSTGVIGTPQEVDRPWQAITDERMANLVCEIGPTHAPSTTTPSKPQSPYSDA